MVDGDKRRKKKTQFYIHFLAIRYALFLLIITTKWLKFCEMKDNGKKVGFYTVICTVKSF